MSTGGSFNVSIPTPVSVANGGTGLATIPANAVVIGNGTGAVTTVAPGANGNVLIVAAGVWTSAPPAAAGAPGAGTYIVQVPNGSLPNAQALSALATGLLKSTTTTGLLSIATGADLPAHSATLITSGNLALARGGTSADLSVTGGVNQFLKQVTAAGAVTVAVISASDIASALTTSSIAFSTVTGIVPLAQGGAGVSLAGTGGANQFVKQVTLGGTLTVAGILSADLTTALTTPPAIGGTTPAAITGTTGVFGTSVKTPIIFPVADSTSAVKVTKADGSTSVVVVDTTNSRVGIGVIPLAPFEVQSATQGGCIMSGTPTYPRAAGLGVTGGTTSGIFLNTYYNGSNLSASATGFGAIWEFDASVGTLGYYQSGNTSANTTRTFAIGLQMDSTGRLALGHSSALSIFHPKVNDTASGAVTNGVTLERTSSGTPSAGYGTNIRFLLKSSTTAQRVAATIKALWNVETDAGRAPDIVITATDANAEREIMRGRANGSAPLVAFLGATPAIQQTGGAATATAIWTATEQGMLQKAYDALRTFGFLN